MLSLMFVFVLFIRPSFIESHVFGSLRCRRGVLMSLVSTVSHAWPWRMPMAVMCVIYDLGCFPIDFRNSLHPHPPTDITGHPKGILAVCLGGLWKLLVALGVLFSILASIDAMGSYLGSWGILELVGGFLELLMGSWETL